MNSDLNGGPRTADAVDSPAVRHDVPRAGDFTPYTVTPGIDTHNNPGKPMRKQRLAFEEIYPSGPHYSRGVRAGNMLFISGCTANGSAAENRTPMEQLHVVLDRITRMAAAEGGRCRKADNVRLRPRRLVPLRRRTDRYLPRVLRTGLSGQHDHRRSIPCRQHPC